MESHNISLSPKRTRNNFFPKLHKAPTSSREKVAISFIDLRDNTKPQPKTNLDNEIGNLIA